MTAPAVDVWTDADSDRLDAEVLILRHGRELIDWCRGDCGRAVVAASRWRARVLGDSSKYRLGPAPGPRCVVWATRDGWCHMCVRAGLAG